MEDSLNNNVSRNYVTNSDFPVYLHDSSGNYVYENEIIENEDGIRLWHSFNNTISENEMISNNGDGISLDWSSNNNVFGNNITDNHYGITLGKQYACLNNTIYHNNFVNNTHQVLIYKSEENFWDYGYPSGGNYWSDYTGVDLYRGPNQDIPGSDGRGDTHLVIDANNLDHYPLMNPWIFKGIIKVAFLPSWGHSTDPSGWAHPNLIYEDLVNNWFLYGNYQLEFINVGQVSPYGSYQGVTYEKLVASGADVVLLCDPAGGTLQYAQSEMDAIQQFLETEAKGIFTSYLLKWKGGGGTDDSMLALLVGVNASALDSTSPSQNNIYDLFQPNHPIFRNVPDPWHSANTDPLSIKQTQGLIVPSWHDAILYGAQIVAETTDSQAAVITYHNPQWKGLWVTSMPDYRANNVDKQFVYNCIVWLAREEKIESTLRVTALSPVDIMVADPWGSRVGYNPTTGQVVNEIPGATYSGPGTEPQEIVIPYPIIGTYTIHAFGTGLGTFTITMESLDRDGLLIDSEVWTGTAEPEEQYTQEVEVEPDRNITDATPPITTETTVTPTTTTVNPTLTATVTDVLSTVIAAEYFIDTTGTSGTGIPLSAIDGAFDELSEDVMATISISELSQGEHTVYVHGKDSADNWGDFDSCTFAVIKTYSLTVEASPSGASGGNFLVTYTLDEVTYTDEEHTTSWTTEVDVGSTVTISSPQEIIDKIPDDGTRYAYATGAGTFIMDSDKIITLEYETQYYLTMSTNFGTVSPNSGWFDAGTKLTIEAIAPSVIEGEQYVWLGWTGTGDISHNGMDNPAVDAVTMNGPVSETASWRHEFRLTITTSFGTTDPPMGDHWYKAETVVTISATSPSTVEGERYVWDGWTGTGDIAYTGADNPALITLSSPITETASWTHEYYLTTSTNFGSVSPTSNWFEAGSVIGISATPPSAVAGEQYVWNSWSGIGSGSYSGTDNPSSVTMNNPIAEVASWIHQFYLEIEVVDEIGTDISSVVPIPGQGWYDIGVEVDLTAPQDVDFAVGSRYDFRSWTGDVSDTTNTITIGMTAPMAVTAHYVTQYYLTVNNGGHGTASGEGWYDSGVLATFSISPTIVYEGVGTRYVFTQWSGDSTSTNPSDTILMDEPKTVTANWKTQYQVTFEQTGSGTTTYVTYIADTDPIEAVPFTVWAKAGSTLTFSYDEIVNDGQPTRYVLVSADQTSPLTVNGPATITAAYKTQHYLTLGHSPIDPILDSHQTGQGYYDADSMAEVTADLYVDIVVGSSRYMFVYWSGDASGTSTATSIIMSAPKTATANHKIQYYITVTSAHDSPTPSAWVDAGSDFTASVTSPTEIVPNDHQWVCTGFSVDGGAYQTGTYYTFTDVQAAHTIEFAWKEQFWIQVSSSHDLPTTSQWMDQGGSLTVSVTSPADDDGMGTRYRCTGYTLDSNPPITDGSTSYTFENIQDAHTITFNWIAQYYLTMSTNFGEVSPSSGWYDVGTEVILLATPPDVIPNERYVWNGWSGTGIGSYSGPDNPTTITMNSPIIEAASWTHQYYISVSSAHDAPTPSAWVNQGNDFTASVKSPTEVVEGDHQWVCTGFSVDADPAQPGTSNTFSNVQAPHTITFNWKKQFWIQVNSDHDSPTPSDWVDQGDSFTASVDSPADIEPEHHQWVCSGFTVDDGPLQSGTSYTFINVQAPHKIVFSWWEQFWVTLAYTGDTTGQYSDPTSVSAILTVTETGQPLEHKNITFTIGDRSATATTNEDGIVATSITITQPASAPGVTVEFLGDRVYLPRFITEGFTINKEDALVDYTGDTVVPTSARTINLRATVYDSDDGSWGDLTKIQVIFRIYAFTDLTTPVVTTDPIPVTLTDVSGVGVATESIDNLSQNGYIIIVSINENDYYRGPTSDPTALTVYEPTGEFVTGGGWIWDPSGSKGNFGFNVKYTKSGKPKGHSIYVYREGEWNYIVKSNAWIGLAIDSEENHAYFEAKCVVQKYNPETEELVWDEGNYKFRVDVWDNDGDGGVDVYQIRVLDKNGVLFHEAGFDPLGELQGGNIIIHDERKRK